MNPSNRTDSRAARASVASSHLKIRQRQRARQNHGGPRGCRKPRRLARAHHLQPGNRKFTEHGGQQWRFAMREVDGWAMGSVNKVGKRRRAAVEREEQVAVRLVQKGGIFG